MVAQAPGVDVGRGEAMAEGIHGQQGGVTGLVAEVVFEFTTGELGAAGRLGGHETGVGLSLLAGDAVAHERKRQSAEVAASAETCDYDVGILAGFLHLLLGLKADNGLVEGDMVKHRPQAIFAVGSGLGQLHGL